MHKKIIQTTKQELNNNGSNYNSNLLISERKYKNG